MATTYANMGNVFDSQGKYDQALEFYEKDLKITKRVLGIVFFFICFDVK